MPRKQSYDYDSADTIIYQTDGYAGSHADVDDTERYTDDIDLSVMAGAVIDFKFDATGSTDDLVVTLYKRRDSSWTGVEIAWKSAITVANDGTEDIYSYTIPDEYRAGHYRFGLKMSGSTDTAEMEVNMRRWRHTEGIA